MQKFPIPPCRSHLLVRITSLAVATALLASLPASVVADSGSSSEIDAQTTSCEKDTVTMDTGSGGSLADLEFVNENEERRGEYEKHFLCEDGSYVAVSYDYPVNY